jgi:maltooligosyltrehalose trehalohydrolase
VQAVDEGSGAIMFPCRTLNAQIMTDRESTLIDIKISSVNNRKFRPVGAFYSDTKTSFVIWAPNHESVELFLGGQAFSLRKDDFGYWQTDVENVKAGDNYMFKIDQGVQIPDPASLYQPEGVHGASAVVDRAFGWNDHEWRGLSLAEMIIYEIHVGTFTNEGTFDAVISKLGYLDSLGVNTIEIMPVSQFPGDRNWGYDGVFPFAVQTSYGAFWGLKRLVDACHQNGMAVILDVVYNHLGPEGNYLELYGPYFTDKYKTGWGKALNFDDEYCDGVRNFFIQNARMWLEEFHIDGLRLDAVHSIWDFSAVHFMEELRLVVESRTKKKKVLIAELDLNNPRYINSSARGGYQLDGQWNDEFHHALHSLLTGETDGYYEDFGNISHLERAYRDSYVYTGQYSKHRKKHFGKSPTNTYDQFVVFAQNHDQIGNRLFGDRLSQTLSFDQLKLAAAAYLLSPHVPMLFMGEEYGEKNPFQYFISHSDEKLIQAVREGRKKEFEYFGWKEEIPDPQSEETFLGCKLSWAYNSHPVAETLLNYYRFLINFRKTRNAMKGVSRESLQLLPSQDKVVSFIRSFEDDAVAVILNFSDRDAIYNAHFSQDRINLLDSSSPQWGGKRPFEFSGNKINISPYSVLVFEC